MKCEKCNEEFDNKKRDSSMCKICARRERNGRKCVCRWCGKPYFGRDGGDGIHADCLQKENEAKSGRPTEFRNHSEEYFWSLVRPAEKAKRRPCLKCRKPMKTTSSNRICSHCSDRVISEMAM